MRLVDARVLRLFGLLVTLALGSVAPPAWSQEQAPKAAEPAEFIAVQSGDLPIVLSAPHGGTLQIPQVTPRVGEGLEKKPGGFVTSRDSGTEELTWLIAQQIEARFHKKPYVVASRVHRKYVDFNRSVQLGTEAEAAARVHRQYHDTLAKYCQEITRRFRGGVLLDIHGQGSRADTVFRGTQNGLTTTLLRERFGDAALTGPEGLFGLLAARGWTVFPVEPDGREQAGFNGGYIVRTYGSHKPFALDAYQLEFGGEYRQAAVRQRTATVLADALLDYAGKYLNLRESPAAARPAAVAD